MDAPPAETQSLWNRFAVFLGPLLLTNALQAGSGTLVNIYLGQALGTQALATASTIFPIMMMMAAFLMSFTVGASVLCGQAWGARDIPRLRQVAGSTLVAAMGTAVVVICAAAAGMPFILAALQVPGEIMPEAVLYGRIAVANTFITLPTVLLMAMLRATGNTTAGFRGLVVFCIVLAAATPVLVHALGVVGAAVASGAAMLGNLAWLAREAHVTNHPLAWAQLRHHFSTDRGVLRQVIRLGVPGAATSIVAATADMAIYPIVNAHGADAAAAWGVVLQLTNWLMFPAMGIAMAASVFTAQAVGARDTGSIDDIVRCALAMNVLTCGALGICFTLGAPWLMALFLTDPAVRALGAAMLGIAVWGSMLAGMSAIFNSVMRATGTVLQPTAINIACLAMVLVPSARLFDEAFGARGIWLAYPVTNGCILALMSAFFFGYWRGRPVEKLV